MAVIQRQPADVPGLNRGFPVAQRIEAIANPDVVRHCSGKVRLLDQIVVGKCSEVSEVRIIDALQSFADDVSDEGDSPDSGQRTLEFTDDLR